MQDFEQALEKRKNAMLSEHPQLQTLTGLVVDAVSDMLHEDFDAITRKTRKMQLVFSCAAEVLERIRAENVRKKYATDVMDIFLDRDIAAHIKRVLGPNGDACIYIMATARAHLCSSQWSDASSTHWEKAIRCFKGKKR